jgi:3-methylcrotonyl-CoA carboxylase alpha subunit
VDTGFLDRRPGLVRPEEAGPSAVALAAAVGALIARRAREARHAAARSGDRHSPWAQATAWRLNGEGYQDFVLRDGERSHGLRAYPRADGGFRLDLGDRALEVDWDGATLSVDGVRRRAVVAESGPALTVLVDGAGWTLTHVDPLAAPEQEGAGDDRLVAPMPGRIVSLHTEPGAKVGKGDVLLVLEAMKVQMRLAAPRDGTIASVRVQAGELVEDGVELVTFAS